MQKLMVVLLVVVLALGVAGCSKDNNPDPNPGPGGKLEGDLAELIEEIYETAELSQNFKDWILGGGVATTEITSENMEWFLGKSDYEFVEAYASEPLISASAYSLILVRVKPGTDIAAMKQEIRQSVDPRKWVCVGVEEQNILVDHVGDVIILIMSNFDGPALLDAFKELDK